MKISVVTICYNAIDGIEKTIQSVIGQTYKDIEYIVIDGGSTDGTVDVIKKYEEYIERWVSEPDKGIYDAMNKGIEAATGDFIQFLNAGDVYHDKECLSLFVPQICPTTIIAYGKVNFIYSIMSKVREPYPLHYMKRRMPFNHPATFVKTSYHKEHLFDVSYRSSGDYDFLYKAYYNDHVKFQHIPVIIADFEAEQGISSSNYLLRKQEDARLQGIDNTIFWKITFTIESCVYEFKRLVKPFIPNACLETIKRRRIENFR